MGMIEAKKSKTAPIRFLFDASIVIVPYEKTGLAVLGAHILQRDDLGNVFAVGRRFPQKRATALVRITPRRMVANFVANAFPNVGLVHIRRKMKIRSRTFRSRSGSRS